MAKFHGVSRVKARRIFRSRRRQVDELAETATQHIDRHVFRRLNNFASVSRFMIAWLLLIGLLISGVIYQTRSLAQYYLTTKPIDGGILSEAMIGTYTNPNPLFASSTIDLSISKLLFNSILTYDTNGQLVNDLATSIIRSENGLSYDVTIRSDCLWQDGQPLTADDVVYTYQAIKNPDTKSPYSVTWQPVKITRINAYQVRFELPSPLNSFPISLTGGILPKHILENTPLVQLRSSDFNNHPIGSGPFKFSKVIRIDDIQNVVKKQRIELVKNDTYFKGAPKLDAYVLYALSSDEELKSYLNSRQVDSAIFNSNPKIEDGQKGLTTTSIPLLAGTYIFFNTSQSPLDSKEIRQALLLGTDTNGLLASLGYPTQSVKSPLLNTDIGFDPTLIQQSYDKDKANQILDSLGWEKSTDGGPRHNGDKVLEVSITTLDNSDFALLASLLQQSWAQDLGIKVSVVTKSPSDIQSYLLQHNYSVLLYGISMGSDPDVYAYWHSSQAVEDRYNLSLYKSEIADQSLEAGRSRPDIALRAVKYKPFLESWRNDVPAIGLYQPPIFYVSNVKIHNFNPHKLNTTAERFYNVNTWQVQTSKQPIIE